MWFDILKKEKPVAANYASKRILWLADKIEELVAEVKIHSSYFSDAGDNNLGASLEFSLEDSKGKKNPVGYIGFSDLTKWKKYNLDSIRDIRNRYLKEVEQIERRENQIGYNKRLLEYKKRLLEHAKYRYEERIKEVKMAAFQETHYFTFKWHKRNQKTQYEDSMEEAIESPTLRVYHELGAKKVHRKKYDEESIIQLIVDLKDFIKDTRFSWGDG